LFQSRKLLDAPEADTVKSRRDRAILSTLLFHALRREELCKLKVKDFRHTRKGVPHLKVSGKGGKTRYVPLHPGTHGLINDYLDAAGHGLDEGGALFRPVRNNRTGRMEGAITADGVYRLVRGYSAQLGFQIGAHALRATAATNALDTRGVQIIRPREAREISEQVSSRWGGRNSNREYTTFIAEDWRHKKITEISTDPVATTNYFIAKENDLPFELSPAFFKPEVLSKYKTDRDKYTIDEREIHCRAAWTLKAYDVNDAGQVFAYICYLRNLPDNEQLHWKSYNEEPKTSISKRALINDFKGEFVTFQSPRSEVLSILRRWQARETWWWTLRDEDLLHRANPPITASKDEWAEAVMDLSKLVVEGFEVKPLRAALSSMGEAYDAKDQTIALLEKLVAAKGIPGDPATLDGLRRVQHIRSKVKGHAGSSEGKTLAQEALAKHGTYGEHFKHICELIVQDLERIELVLKP
jgi:hypothetical protein